MVDIVNVSTEAVVFLKTRNFVPKINFGFIGYNYINFLQKLAWFIVAIITL